jgi:hypothetical protein
MPTTPLAADTSAEIEAQQVEGWRQMTATQKAAIVTGLTQAVLDLALEGVRHRYPDASPREQFLRRAIVIHGRNLAARAYPEIDELGLE